MGIEKKTATFKLVATSNKVGEDIMPALIANSYQDMPEGEEVRLTDVTRGISIANGKPQGDWDFRYGTTIYFALRTREKVVDPRMVKEYLAYLIDKEFKETGTLPRGKRKKEMKEIAKSAVQSSMITKTSGARVIIPLNTKMVIMELSNDKKVDEANQYLFATALKDNPLVTVNPNYLYTALTNQPSEAYKGFMFGEELRCSGIGVDFLTWLWMASETDGMLPKGIRSAIIGDISFRNDKDCARGSIVTKMSKGIPWEGDGPRAAFEDGKKICSATFRIARDGANSYDVVIDESFTFKNFKLANLSEESSEEEEKHMHPEELFSDAVTNIQLFSEILVELFKTFLSRVDQNEADLKAWYEKRWSEE